MKWGNLLRGISIVALTATSLGMPAGAAESCGGPTSGGEWRSYGHDLSNTRTQSLEDQIDASNVATLAAGWNLDLADVGADGAFQSTPAVADGCLYIATDSGWVISLNADNGELNWKVQLTGGVFGLTLTDDGTIVALVNDTDEPYATALDRTDGSEIWRADPPQTRTALRTNASPVVFDGLVFMGYSVVEGDVGGHAGYQILDLGTGEQLAHGYVVPPEDWDEGYGGGGVWTTGVVDPTSKHVFVGTSNPTSKKIEHRQHNAVLKIDLDRNRPTFGQVVDNAKGNYDQYYPGLDRQPACRETGDQILYAGFSVTCAQLDLDFGASPNLFTDDEGDTLVGILQKSGVYHVFYADTMQQAWTQILAPPCLQCNFSSTATDGSTIFGVGTPPGQMVAFEAHRGAYRWAMPIGDGLHHQAVSTANGVVYTVDSIGFLDAFDATTGVPLLRRYIGVDTVGSTVALSSAGIAIARHTLYVPASSNLVAYRIPA